MSCPFHEVPGRLRIKINELKHQPLRAQQLESLFTEMTGVDRVAVNVSTGSMKVFYDPKMVNSGQLMNVLQAAGVRIEDRRSDPESDRFAIRASQVLGRAMVNWAVSKTLESRGLGLLAALI